MSNLENSVKLIFEHMNIEKIYHIDDYYELDYKTSFLAQFSTIDSSIIESLFDKNDLDYTSNTDIDKQTLLENWEKISPKEIEEIISGIDENFLWDIQSSSTVEKLFNKVELEKLSPSVWEKQKEQISQTLNDNKTLFLFDNDWGEGLENSGIKAIKDLTEIPDINLSNIMCGLYTHTVKPNEEFLKRDSLSEDENVSIDNFLVISKQHSEESFVKSLRTTAIMPTLKDFKSKIHEHIIESSKEVDRYINEELDIVDLEYITLDKSLKEGEWEPKTLYRLHKNRHIKEFREKIFNDSTLHEDIEKMRGLKNLSSDVLINPSKTKEIMKDELFDEKVNEYNCPLKSGDIFESHSGKKFIILMQPCELMIRSNGERGNTHEYKTFANLVEINTRKTSYPIKYFNEEEYYLQFPKTKKVELDILDLCTYSKEGKCEINLNRTIFEHKLAGLKKRYLSLHKKYTKLHELWDNANRNSDMKKYLFMPYGKGILNVTIPNPPSDQIINFGLKRINRVSKEIAHDLQVNLLSYLSRSAMEVDLAN